MRQYLYILSFIVLSALLPSCSFNRIFFQPDVIPAKAKGQTIVDNDTHDTMTILFSGENHQPVFIKNNDTISPDYNIESVMFRSANGYMLNGWFLRPKNGKVKATVLHMHGNAGNVYSQHQLIGGLTKHGFQVFVFDYSGYGFSQGKSTAKSTLADALSAIDYVKGRNDTKNMPLIVYGQSLGGHLSAVAANAAQDKVDALVIEGAFSSRKDIAAHFARQMYIPGFIARWLVTQPYSAKKKIESFKNPVLIIHSSEDETNPYRMGKRLYRHANEPKSFYEIKGPHIRGVQIYCDSIAARIDAMLHK